MPSWAARRFDVHKIAQSRCPRMRILGPTANARTQCRKWPIAPFPGSIEWPQSKGNRTTLRNREDRRPRGVAKNRSPSLVIGQDRFCGRYVIASRRSNSAHFHRPWRATVRFCTIPFDFAAADLASVVAESSPYRRCGDLAPVRSQVRGRRLRLACPCTYSRSARLMRV
jgi:hypothetical protein